jgi:phenylpropionate dioxygenase-like ring-hydroxylating dioxygenase large terminal subunit
VQFEHNIEKGDSEPTPISIFDLEMVLFRDKDGGIKCLRDLCPHRAAKLSTGQVNDGNIECLYHGWQFSGEGECIKIPQLGKVT